LPFAGAAVAASDPSLEVQAPGHVEVGESIEITMVLHKSRDVAGYETALLFDTSVADFSVLRQRDNDLKKLGRDVTNLAAVEVPYGASVGLFTCPTQDCLTRQGAKNKHGGNGTIKLGTVVIIPHQAGLLQINLGPTQVVDANGATLPLELPTTSLTIQVGAAGAGPVFPAPSSPWSLPSPNAKLAAPGNVDLTEDGRVTNADAMEVALVWTWLRNHSQACGALPRADVDINHDGCVDVADMQLVAAGYSAATADTQASGAAEMSALAPDSTAAGAADDQPDHPGGRARRGSSVPSAIEPLEPPVPEHEIGSAWQHRPHRGWPRFQRRRDGGGARLDLDAQP
jgi:hypothetical protein